MNHLIIRGFRPSQKARTKFRQNWHTSILFGLSLFFSSNQFKLKQKALKNLLLQGNSKDCQGQPK